MLPAASRTPVSQSSTSAAEFSPKDLLSLLSKVRLSLERRKEGQVPSRTARLLHATADQFQRRPQLSFRELVNHVMQLFARLAHATSVRIRRRDRPPCRRGYCHQNPMRRLPSECAGTANPI